MSRLAIMSMLIAGVSPELLALLGGDIEHFDLLTTRPAPSPVPPSLKPKKFIGPPLTRASHQTPTSRIVSVFQAQ